MTAVHLESIIHRYDSLSHTFQNLDLTITSGEFLVLVGPSGCGKSTLLRLIAGLEKVQSGRIRFDEDDVTLRSPRQRNIAMVFQNYALYPHMNVRANLELTLKIAGVPQQERERRVREVSEYLEISEYLSKKPAHLSGGQRQRVAMGRALVRNPAVFLFDEPLSNLDAELRTRLRAQIKNMHKRFPATKVYVTHDQVEAMTLADRIVVLKSGVIQQVGSPSEIYDDPQNIFVAQFFGSPPINVLDPQTWKLDPEEFFDASGWGKLAADFGVSFSECLCGLRPEQVHVRPVSHFQNGESPLRRSNNHRAVAGVVLSSEHLGSQRVLNIESPVGRLAALVGAHECAVLDGERVELTFSLEQFLFFRKDDGVRLRSSESSAGSARTASKGFDRALGPLPNV